MVGVGQSMYQISRYMEANTLGTAHLLDILVNRKNKVKKLIVASSMSTYGEGAYNCPECGRVSPPLRTDEQMAAGDFEIHCPECGKIVIERKGFRVTMNNLKAGKCGNCGEIIPGVWD